MSSMKSGTAQPDVALRAIQTEYRGYLFRSRLEARWAVFFDALGLKWEYEPEGYDLPSGRYLPDFYLRDFKVFAEIKPSDFPVKDAGTIERCLCHELADLAGTCVFMFAGDPYACIPQGTLATVLSSKPNYVDPQADARLAFDEFCRPMYAELPSVDGVRAVAFKRAVVRGFWPAASKARRARFEHGEQP